MLVHGLGGASTNWTDLMYLLRDRFDCWAPDLSGFGRSDPPPRDDYSLTVMSPQSPSCASTSSPRQVGRCTCSATPWAERLLYGLPPKRPDLVRTLTLISPAMPVIWPRRGTDPRLPLLLLPGISWFVSRASSRQTAQQRVQAILQLCFADPSAVPQVRVDEAVAELERRRGLAWFDTALMASLRGIAASYLQRGGNNLWAQAGQIKAPTLVIWGRHDRLVSVSIAARTQRAIPGARLVVYEDAGHVAMLEHPVRVAREFLSAL